MKKKIFKRTISLLMVFCMLFTGSITISAESSNDFEDVKNYYPFSSWAVDVGIKYQLIFLENNTRETKRYEIANIVANILDLDEKKESKIEFVDINDVDGNIKSSIEKVSSNNIITGFEDGTFRPNDFVTRAEFVTILDRADLIGKNKEGASIAFSDIHNHWAKASIEKVAKTGIVSGKSSETFCPDDTITPQEILLILDRLVSSKVITSNQLIESLTQTFKCKVYSGKEKYIIEEIYSEFEETQNHLKYNWPYDEQYDPTNWQELATYQDLHYALLLTGKHSTDQYNIDSLESRYHEIGKQMYELQGLEYNGTHANDIITFKTLLSSVVECTGAISWYYVKNYPHNLTLEFTNLNELSEKDKEYIFNLAVTDSGDEKFIKNSAVYFPLDAPVTKHMLNYYIIKLRESCNWIEFAIGDVELETDPNNVPYNYEQFPYIIKGVPKEIYETQTEFYSRPEFHDAKELYLKKIGTDEREIAEFATKYYNTILNVDYRTIDADKFKSDILSSSYFANEDYIDEYIEYVKENEIIIKGSAQAIPGTVILCGFLVYIRMKIDFEIVNAKDNTNLILNDIMGPTNRNVKYKSNKYSYIFDNRVEGGMVVKPDGTYMNDNYRTPSMNMYELIFTKYSGFVFE